MAPVKPKKQRHVRKCTSGCIDPERIYTYEGCIKHFGFGRELLAQARQSGLVKPVVIGRRSYYLGRQLHEWVELLAQQQHGAD